ncbi:MAG: hypothetical protein E7488_02665 [Ruminococcaceae bacterium]|nr:hypothetical protein [Oscillospiraceae bacterium]
MYCPGNTESDIVKALINETYPVPFSMAFCLEDTVKEDKVEEAEENVSDILKKIQAAKKEYKFFMPLIFVRVRSTEQLKKLVKKYDCFKDVLTGFILPKFFIDNCDEYIEIIKENRTYGDDDFRYMPIFESDKMVNILTRGQHLMTVKEKLDQIKEVVLNIRVGGNDLSHAFGLRRPVEKTIYDVKPVERILTDVVSVFSMEYVVSGPVWEYYSGEGWQEGMEREMQLDLISGFIGKTVIHPNQIKVVNDMLKVEKEDFEDAKQILGWDDDSSKLVSASSTSSRMNEYNTHFNWAKKILTLGNIYGIKNS